MKNIIITSQGVIDPQAFSLIGASSKRGDKSKIGFFGSGLKYSIAYLLRNNIAFKVFGDFQEHTFGKEPMPFRDKSFDVITVNGERTSLTTEMGIDWEAWFIIREIYCNALDESEATIKLSSKEAVPIQDSTVFYIDSEPFKEVVDNWGKYFSEGREENQLLYSGKDGFKIYSGGAERITYRKGIRCQHSEETCIFHYDLPDVQINESRTIKSDWDFEMNLTRRLCMIDDVNIVTSIITLYDNNWERGLKWNYTAAEKFNDSWLDAIGGRTLVPDENGGFWHDLIKKEPHRYLPLPSILCNALKTFFGSKVYVIGQELGGDKSAAMPIEESPRMKFMLNQANEFLIKAGYKVGFPIEIVKFANANRMGQAVKDKILISEKVFDKGSKYLVTTIVEENEHHISSFGDETREFQNHIFEKLVSLMEEKANIYL